MGRDSFSSRLSQRLTSDGGIKWKNEIPDSDSMNNAILKDSPDGTTNIPLSPVRWTRRKRDGDQSPDVISYSDIKDESFFPETSKSPQVYSETVFYGDATPSQTGEVPKVAIKKGLRANLMKFTPHLAAILVTLSVVQLSYRNAYWMDLLPPEQHILPGLTQSGALNFLQLAAKLHELLILASLTCIVVHVAQIYLISRTGLPLSLIATIFDVGSGVYMFRKGFWTAWFSVDPHTGRRFPFLGFWLLVLSSSALVILAGPSSAIAVIPTLNYFNIARPFNTTVFPYYVMNQSTVLWPSTVDTGSLTAPNSGISCLDPTDASVQLACPWGDFTTLQTWSLNLGFIDPDRGTNISFADSRGDVRRILTAQSCNSSFDGRASAVSLNQFLSNSLTAYWTYAQKNLHGLALESAQPRLVIDSESNIYGPRIEVMCNTYANDDFNGTNLDVQPSMTFPTFNGTVSKPIPVPDSAYKYVRNVTDANFTFVEISDKGPGAPSLGAVITVPMIYQNEDTSNWFQTSENIACSIFAQWIPMNVWYEPETSDQVSYSVGADMVDTCLKVPVDTIPGKQPINTTITQAYADTVNLEIPFIEGSQPAILSLITNYLVNSSLVPDGVFFNTPVEGETSADDNTANPTDVALRIRARLMSLFLAGTMTDALAGIAGSGQFPFSPPVFVSGNRTKDQELIGTFIASTASGGIDESLNTTNPAVLDSWLSISPVVQRFGYGYHWQGSRTTQFGLLVLLIHTLVAITHTFIVLFLILVRNKGLPNSWQTIPEMIALATNSRSSEKLRNTCAGINEVSTWKTPIGVRETTEGHLEFVFGRDEMENNQLPQTGARYGALPEVSSENMDKQDLRRRYPRKDWK